MLGLLLTDPHLVGACLISSLGGVLCLLGDHLAARAYVRTQPHVRALVDNCTHGLVGAVTWAAVAYMRYRLRHQILGTLLAGVLSSLVDIDHFLMANSWQLKAALSLPHRPPFHCTTWILPLATVLHLAQRLLPCCPLPDLACLASLSLLTHHLRDAHRRGLWFWPLGSTPPLPASLYVGLTVLLPLTVRLVLGLQHTDTERLSV